MLVLKAYDIMGQLVVELTEVSTSDSGELCGRFIGRVHTGLKSQDELFFTLDQLIEVLAAWRIDLAEALAGPRSL